MFGKGEYRQAIGFFEKIDRDGAALRMNLMRAYLYTQDEKAAKTQATKIIADFDVMSALSERTRALVQEVANGDITDAMAQPPKQGVAANQGPSAKGWQYFRREMNKEAADKFRGAIAENADDIAAVNGLAFCLLNQGNTNAALPLFEKVLLAEPNHYGAINGKARCLVNQDPDQAIALWQKIVKEAAGPSAATAGLATHYLSQKENKKAIPFLAELAAAVAPESKHWQRRLKAAKTADLSAP